VHGHAVDTREKLRRPPHLAISVAFPNAAANAEASYFIDEKGEAMSSMESLEDVGKWINEHNEDGNGIEHLRKTLAVGLISGRSAGFARAWLEEHATGEQRRLEAEQLELARRSAAAAETSASAAAESARRAAESAKWTKLAAVIAVFALLVSAWPYMKDVGRPPATTSSAGNR